MNQDEAKKLAFHNEMVNLYKKISKQLKYKSTKLLDMINKYGGYEAAIKFIKSESNTFDFTILWENERLDLSVEALITNANYRELFPEEVVSFCDRKLKDYNFSPKKIIEEKVEPKIVEKTIDSFEDLSSHLEQVMPVENKKEYIILNRPIDICKETWKELFASDTVFPAKNKDLVLRIALINGYVEAAEISDEEGYNIKYPYKEVVMALAKRIKAKTKIEVPITRKGEMLWWHILFLGGFKDNTCFEWRVRPELKLAIEELIVEGKVDVGDIQVKTHKVFEEEEDTVQETPAQSEPILVQEVKTEETAPVEQKVKIKVEPKKAEPTIAQEVKLEAKSVIKPEIKVVEKGSPAPEKENAGDLDSFIDSLLSDMDAKPAKKIVQSAPKSKDSFAFPEIDLPDNLFGDLEDDKLEELIDGLLSSKDTEADRKPEVGAVEEIPQDNNSVAKDLPVEPVIAEEVLVTATEVNAKVSKEDEEKWEKLKDECLDYYGAICEICGFDYGYTYGEAFEKHIEIHHVNAKVNEDRLPDTDPIKDLIPICHNCHSIIHTKTPPYTVDEMRIMLKSAH